MSYTALLGMSTGVSYQGEGLVLSRRNLNQMNVLPCLPWLLPVKLNVRKSLLVLY